MKKIYQLMLPLPGGDRACTISLNRAGGVLTGTISNPYRPEEACAITDGAVQGNAVSIHAMVGRTEFVFEGTAEAEELFLTLTTHETIPLKAGKRLSGTTGELEGEYLVSVYSPGGDKENHFVLRRDGAGFGGEMYGLMDEKMLDFLAHMPPMPPDGPADLVPRPQPKLGDKCDENPFLSVTGDASQFEIETRTGNGSLFRFAGSVLGDSIEMTLFVTDCTTGLRAAAMLPE